MSFHQPICDHPETLQLELQAYSGSFYSNIIPASSVQLNSDSAEEEKEYVGAFIALSHQHTKLSTFLVG